MTGDVLPCYDFSHFSSPNDGVCIVVVPAPSDVAANHGVVLTSPAEMCGETFQQVIDLLQKPSYESLMARGALSANNTVLLDSGIFSVRGKAWENLIKLSIEDPDPVLMLLEQKQEVSFYEEIAAAWVPSQHEWLSNRPLGRKLLDALSFHCLISYCAHNLTFLHFGTSMEVLSHITSYFGGKTTFCRSNLDMGDSHVVRASSGSVIASDITGTVHVGDQSLIYNCTLKDGVHIGRRCIILGIDSESLTTVQGGGLSLVVPDQHCLWEVPLIDSNSRVTLCCSIQDNPKVSIHELGKFCGKQWEDVFNHLGVGGDDLWLQTISSKERNLWNASLFPVVSAGKGIIFAMWLMGLLPDHDNLVSEWRTCKRMSLAELHGFIDFQKLHEEFKTRKGKISLQLADASIKCGSLHQDLSNLCMEILEGLDAGKDACEDLLTLYLNPKFDAFKVPQSRTYQAGADLYCALGDVENAAAFERKAWDAVAKETAIAVEPSGGIYAMHFSHVFQRRRVKVELPARVDFAGGWSDTPPWSLEQLGTVLNMAILLEGCAPIGVELEVTGGTGVCIADDAGHHICIKDPAMLHPPYEHADPFRLVKSALVVTGLASSTNLLCTGISIKTWANVPRGSGLGTSSILAAAVVRAIYQAIGADDASEKVSSAVLLLEQLMGTGGGWQDQVGALYPGIKCTSGSPGNSLSLKVEPVSLCPQTRRELEKRLIIFFTGQVRLAHNVLRTVVRRYLQRDPVLISSIKNLVSLANYGREALESGHLNEFGRILLDVWLIHQELDPFCSNEDVDRIFKHVHAYSQGYKLVGAGGGGFGLLIANDEESALIVKEVLTGLSVRVYGWSISE
ncbi:hypothetical protein KP509_21G086500 [Ceratopteris richardii]|nr:hypothetical protein KP509_21G086500 [Ceratopteris richardii]